MNDVERWIYLDGPPPEHIECLLDALRGDRAPHTPADQERVSRRFFATLSTRTGRSTPAPFAETGPGDVMAEPAAAPPAPPPVDLPADDVIDPEPASDPAVMMGNAPAPSPPAVVPAPAALKSTADLNIPSELLAKWPFAPAPPPSADAPAPGRAAAKTLQTPAVPPGFGSTVDFGDTLQKFMPPLPFAGSTTGTTAVPYPNLKIEAYATFCVELAAYPDRVADIRVRYHVVSDAAHAALDDHWRQYFAAHPEHWAWFSAYMAHYAAWLRALPR